MSGQNCPSHQILVAYQTGELSETTAESVTSHVTTCAECQAELATLDAAPDPFIDCLRMPAPEEPYANEPQLARMLRNAMSLRVGGPSAVRASDEPAAQEPLIERVGEYELLAKLGEGGMGAVYKARHRKLKQIAAIKVLPKERLSDARAVARFEREMEAVGVLSHPNIVRAMYAGEDNGTPYLVVEYVDGLNLSEIAKRLGALGIADACELVRQAAVGLQHAHENGLVHRDIKPSNLMLTTIESSMALLSRASSVVTADISTNRHGSGEPYAGSVPATLGLVKILDLGLALLQADPPQDAEMTAAGSAMGTADYIAPEQVTDSHNVDIRADIYSLGCTLYKLLAGRAPFVGPEYKNDVAKMMAHVHQVPPPIAGLRTDLPAELAAIVQRMMAKEPSQRYATPAEVAAALAPFVAGCDLANVLSRGIQFVEPTATDPARSATTGQLSASPVSDTTPHPQPVISAEGPASPASQAVAGDDADHVSPLAPVSLLKKSWDRLPACQVLCTSSFHVCPDYVVDRLEAYPTPVRSSISAGSRYSGERGQW